MRWVGRRCGLALLALVVLVVGLSSAGCGGKPGGGASPSASPAAALPSLRPSGRPFPRPLPGPFPGLLLIADRGNDRLLLVDGHKRIVWRYPRPGAKPSFPFRYDDDAFFSPDYRSIVTSQEMQHTIQVISFPGGNVLWHYGEPGRPGSGKGRLNRPDDAYLLPDGTCTVADIVNQRVLFISPSGRVVRQYGTTGASGHRPPHLLGAPNGDVPLPGGGMLITEISGSWVDSIAAAGKLEWSVHTPATYPSDAQPLPRDRILLADYTSPGKVFIIDRKGSVLWRYGPSSGGGRLDHPSLAAMLPGGLIAVSDDYRHRVVLIDPASRRIVWQYGHTGSPGSSAGYLDTPDGLDFLPAATVAGSPHLRALSAAYTGARRPPSGTPD